MTCTVRTHVMYVLHVCTVPCYKYVHDIHISVSRDLPGLAHIMRRVCRRHHRLDEKIVLHIYIKITFELFLNLFFSFFILYVVHCDMY